MDTTIQHDHQNAIIHANAMIMHNHVGVLITGNAGIGKSQLCAELIQQGHCIIADDAVLLTRNNSTITAQAPTKTHNLMHVRELGIVTINDYFGETALAKKSPIQLIVHLCPHDNTENLANSRDLLGLSLPQFTFAVKKSPCAITFGNLIRKHVQ